MESNNGGERESSGLSEQEISRLRSVMTVVRSVQRYRPPLGPNGQKRAALPPWPEQVKKETVLRAALAKKENVVL